MSVQVHASLAARDEETGVLLLGPPGAGKSSIALQLIALGWHLVADDRVRLSIADGALMGAPVAATAGLIEARGAGLIRLDFLPQARIRLAVELSPAPVERMPERVWYAPPAAVAGALAARIPLLRLNGYEAATPAIIHAAVSGRFEH